MTNPTVSINESQTLTALRAFLVAIMPSGMEIFKGQGNRVAEPTGADFIVMTPTLKGRISTNVESYSDEFPSGLSTASILQPTMVTVQIDVHGPNSADNVQVITTLFRDEWGIDQFANSGFDVTPLYMGEPHQVPFLNGEQQIETRYSVDCVLHVNSAVAVAQQFASGVQIGLQIIK